MARPRKGSGRRERKTKCEIKRAWSTLKSAPEIVIPPAQAQAEQPRITEVTPP